MCLLFFSFVAFSGVCGIASGGMAVDFVESEGSGSLMDFVVLVDLSCFDFLGLSDSNALEVEGSGFVESEPFILDVVLSCEPNSFGFLDLSELSCCCLMSEMLSEPLI